MRTTTFPSSTRFLLCLTATKPVRGRPGCKALCAASAVSTACLAPMARGLASAVVRRRRSQNVFDEQPPSGREADEAPASIAVDADNVAPLAVLGQSALVRVHHHDPDPVPRRGQVVHNGSAERSLLMVLQEVRILEEAKEREGSNDEVDRRLKEQPSALGVAQALPLALGREGLARWPRGEYVQPYRGDRSASHVVVDVGGRVIRPDEVASFNGVIAR